MNISEQLQLKIEAWELLSPKKWPKVPSTTFVKLANAYVPSLNLHGAGKNEVVELLVNAIIEERPMFRFTLDEARKLAADLDAIQGEFQATNQMVEEMVEARKA